MRAAVLLACVLVACGGPGANSASNEPEVEEKVIVERMPDGSVKRTTIRTTRKKVPAQPLPP